MHEDQQIKKILKRGGMVTASTDLENAIMTRVKRASAARKKIHQPLLNIRLLLGVVLTYSVLSLLILLVSFMLDLGYTFEAENIPAVFALKSSTAATLVLSLLVFWALVFASFALKNFINRSYPKS